MSFLDILAKAAGIPVQAVEAIINAGAAAVPDLKPEADKLVAWIDSEVDPAKVVAFAAVLFGEASNIEHGVIDPRDHASDAG